MSLKQRRRGRGYRFRDTDPISYRHYAAAYEKTRLSSNGRAELISIRRFYFPPSVRTFPLFFFFFFIVVVVIVRANTDLWVALIRDQPVILNIRSVKNVFLKSPPDNTETDLSDLQSTGRTRGASVTELTRKFLFCPGSNFIF